MESDHGEVDGEEEERGDRSARPAGSLRQAGWNALTRRIDDPQLDERHPTGAASQGDRQQMINEGDAAGDTAQDEERASADLGVEDGEDSKEWEKREGNELEIDHPRGDSRGKRGGTVS